MFEDIIKRSAVDMGLALPEEAPGLFRAYYDRLAGAALNLTAVKGEDESASLHFADSIALMKYADFAGKKVLDVGTGGGFPGVPLKIAEPSVDITLIDSTGKKVDFVRESCEALSIDAQCVCARAEELAGERREMYDIVTSRAVARLDVLSELCMPFVKVGGLFIAMKSTGSDEEIDEAKPAIKALGGKIEDISDYLLPGTDVTHRAVIIRKTAKTDTKYPRKYAKIIKNPIK